jgi:hypothetical protein
MRPTFKAKKQTFFRSAKSKKPITVKEIGHWGPHPEKVENYEMDGRGLASYDKKWGSSSLGSNMKRHLRDVSSRVFLKRRIGLRLMMGNETNVSILKPTFALYIPFV